MNEQAATSLLVEPRNRAILSTLRDTGGALDVRCLAERLVAHNNAILGSAEFEDELEQLLISLHHDRLPRLAEAGLLEYDADENVVAERVPADDGLEWFGIERLGEFSVPLTAGHGDDGTAIGVVEGRENTLEHGRQLADRADEELFVMFIGDEFLEYDCLRTTRSAIERGVSVHFGTHDEDIREAVREHLPEAVLWEPQFDWANKPDSYPKVGRLVFADREQLLLAILEEPDPGTTYVETAMTGEGMSNPLVVLVRELLGPRLDHLDYQSDAFRDGLPFKR